MVHRVLNRTSFQDFLFRANLPVGDDVSHTRAGQRDRLVKPDNGASWEILTTEKPGAELSLFVLELAPGQDRPLTRTPRPGDKFIHVIEGNLQLELDAEKFILLQGDSIHFKASQTLKMSNLGDTQCRVFWADWPRFTL